jgi:hypothetical protein
MEHFFKIKVIKLSQLIFLLTAIAYGLGNSDNDFKVPFNFPEEVDTIVVTRTFVSQKWKKDTLLFDTKPSLLYSKIIKGLESIGTYGLRMKLMCGDVTQHLKIEIKTKWKNILITIGIIPCLIIDHKVSKYATQNEYISFGKNAENYDLFLSDSFKTYIDSLIKENSAVH